MISDISRLIDESIRLELNVSQLYLHFHNLFPEDSEFWWGLALEEKNHAALLKSGKLEFLEAGLFPPEIVGASIRDLVKTNKELEALLERKELESRASAFQRAIRIEESAGEIHFQQAIVKKQQTEALKLFQQLNRDDKDHAERLRDYVRKMGIGIDNETSTD